ncbi:MAG: ImmA/IrrE family metallo-endopeptidase [Alphaproteobacteria bacterium]
MSQIAKALRSLHVSPEVIASRTGLSITRVNEILDGGEASLSELLRLSKGLRVSLQFLSGSSREDITNEVNLLFRRVGNLDQNIDPTREHAEKFVSAAIEVLKPRDCLPGWMDGLQPEEESYGEAERLAYAVRARLSPENLLEPMTNLAALLGNEGQIVVSVLHQSRFEGASLISKNIPFIFVSRRFAGRMLFTLAHELGHILAHHRDQDSAIFEKASEIGGPKQRKREAFVDAFASILLLPSEGIGRMLAEIRRMFQIPDGPLGDIEVLLLARYFGVSFDVAARRCEALSLLPKGGAYSLSAKIKEEYGSPEKRANEAGLPPRKEVHVPNISTNLMQEICKNIELKAISVGWAADSFGVSVDEIFAFRKTKVDGYSH